MSSAFLCNELRDFVVFAAIWTLGDFSLVHDCSSHFCVGVVLVDCLVAKGKINGRQSDEPQELKPA